jgi:hypothetical protein
MAYPNRSNRPSKSEKKVMERKRRSASYNRPRGRVIDPGALHSDS